jgi:hypothetical protein
MMKTLAAVLASALVGSIFFLALALVAFGNINP